MKKYTDLSTQSDFVNLSALSLNVQLITSVWNECFGRCSSVKVYKTAQDNNHFINLWRYFAQNIINKENDIEVKFTCAFSCLPSISRIRHFQSTINKSQKNCHSNFDPGLASSSYNHNIFQRVNLNICYYFVKFGIDHTHNFYQRIKRNIKDAEF